MEQEREHEHLSQLPTKGWRAAATAPSLSEVFRTIPVPREARFWKRLLAFVGPGYLVAVGYMDPGNWATDIGGGSKFGYALLSVVLISNFIAIFLQALSAKLGIVTGRDLAQACRDAYSKPVSILLWISAEVAIIACDVAEVLGAAIALDLLFGIPLIWGVVITAVDVLLVLALQNKGFRIIETIVIALIATMTGIFIVELALVHPDWRGVANGFVPSAGIIRDSGELFLALGILGATVMPHNLYLHSSIVQTRKYGHSVGELRDAVRLSWTDSTIALMLALFVNVALLIVSAAVFYSHGYHSVDAIYSGYDVLMKVVGASIAAPLFAVALLASGQNSTLTGTLAGQIVLEGFTRIKLAPWIRRMISRVVAIIPSVIAVAIYGKEGLAFLMIFSQVVLSAQLVFAIIPLVQFTSDEQKMGPFVNSALTRAIGLVLGIAIAGLNGYLIYAQLARK